ncbi:MAG: helix-turn-helix domain-containing protein [Anaerolineae bacterium]|nr:helix-turn-helix domain-containing protein [Anaerolineae bacterium]
MKGNKAAIGEWLRQRRSLLRHSRKELAGLANLSPITLKDYELGRRRPSDSATLTLAKVLRVPPHLHEALLQLASGGEPTPAILELVQAMSPFASAQPRPTSTAPLLLVPIPVDTIVGREQAVQQTLHLLAQPGVRLITLAGPPGVGKTRLALEVPSTSNTRGGIANPG